MRRKNNRKTKKNHKQRVYVMKGTRGGSYGCGPSGCPIPAFPIYKGGIGNPSGPFINQAWGSSPYKWPGVDGISSNHTWLPYNKYIHDVPRQIKLGGSTTNTRRRNTRSNTKSNTKSNIKSNKKTIKRGGSLFPQDLVNVGRNISFNFNSAYNSLNGYKAPINPLPYKDQLTNKFNY